MTIAEEDRIKAHGRQLGVLLPPGRAFSREPGGRQSQLLEGMGEEFANLEARTQDLLREFDPTRALELLEDWEEALGLPDPCVGVPATLEERRNAIIARLVALNGANSADLIALGATLGYDIRVAQHRPFQAGHSHAGDELANHQQPFQAGLSRAGDALSNREEWLWVVDIIGPFVTVRTFQAGRSVAGEPLTSWNNALLECTLSRVAPAHILLRFLYELQIKLDAIAESIATTRDYIPDLLFDDDAFDMLRHQFIVLTNDTAQTTDERWNLDAGVTTAKELPNAFVTSEMVFNGGRLQWHLSGFYQNNTGATLDVELAFYNGAAASPLFTVCIEAIPAGAGSTTGAFHIVVDLLIRDTGQAHGSWRAQFCPTIVADGSTAGGQAATHFTGAPFKIWQAVNWNTDVLLKPKIRKKAVSDALVKVLEINCVAAVMRAGTGAEG